MVKTTRARSETAGESAYRQQAIPVCDSILGILFFAACVEGEEKKKTTKHNTKKRRMIENQKLILPQLNIALAVI